MGLYRYLHTMLIIPYRAELSLARPPIVTYAVIVLCLFIHYMQDSNRTDVHKSLFPFCENIYDGSLEMDDVDFLRTRKSICHGFLYRMHSQPDKDVVEGWIQKNNERHEIYTEEELTSVIRLVKQHYDDFSLWAPASLDAKLMYNPSSWNPVRTVSSALSHGDWMHIIGNLIFFFAFAAAIETLLGSKLHFIGFMLLVALITDVSYSLSILVGGVPPLPSLGLSGVVSGVIGLSGFLMPHARIRTLVWFIIFLLRALPIPAWILALWFIGWDAYYLMAYSDMGGVNLIAHVSGGVGGYLYGFLFLKNRREDIQDELDDEIEHMKGARKKNIFASTSSYAGGTSNKRYVEERDAKREHAKYNQKLYRLVNVGNNSEAIVLFLNDYDHYKDSVEIYEELFEEMSKWRGKSRALMCLGRLVISLLLEQNKHKKALAIAKRCLDAKEDFVLADPIETLKLTQHAMELQQYPLAYQLICRAELRYGEYIDLDHGQLLEAKLLLLHLDNRDEAKNTLKRLLDRKPVTRRKEIASLIEVYKHG